MKRKKIIILSVAAVAVIVIAWAIFGRKSSSNSYYIETATAARGDVSNSVTATGSIEPVTQVEVGTQVSGIIDKLYADYNSVVTKGQLIAEMDKVTLQSELTSQQATYDGAKAEYEYQQKNYLRNQALHEKQLISDTEFEESTYNYAKAKSAYESSEANLAKAKRNLAYATITSPIDGVVISRAVEEGQTVAAGFETPTLFTIAADLTQMQVIADVDEADIGGVKEGQRVEFTVDAYPNDTFEGTVTQVRLEATEESNVITYEVVISAHNPDLKLKPGLTANVTIYIAERRNVVNIPVKALRFVPDPPSSKAPAPEQTPQPQAPDNDSLKTVWVQEGQEWKPRQVKVGMDNGVNVEICSGLNEGEVVAVDRKSNTGMTEAQLSGNQEESPFMPKPPGKRNKERRTSTMATKEIIRLENIRRNFIVGNETVHALRGVSFTINVGEFVTIMGTSGSGKSTLLNILGCLDTPTSGEYYLDGIPVRSMGKNERSVLRNRKIGFVFQSYNLLPKTTALENVELPLMYNSAISARQRHELASRALDAVGLSERKNHKSNQMSGGQQQRVAIARALVNDPVIILADEATGNLDTRTSFEILVLFQELHAQGRTIIFVTHNPELSAYSSRNIVLRDGKIISDTPNDHQASAQEMLQKLPVESD